MNIKVLFAIGVLFLSSCADKNLSDSSARVKTILLKEGAWRLSFALNNQKTLPINFALKQSPEGLRAHLFNGAETIVSEPFRIIQDSVYFRLPIFDSEFRLVRKNESLLEGAWYNNTRCCDYNIPVKAEFGKNTRFISQESNTGDQPKNFAGKWKVTFSKGTTDEYMSVGLFEQKGGSLTGTFLTETGDYRYLEGNVFNDQMLLSCFDGSHAFLFEANIQNDGTLKGTFYSGKHWQEPWIATRDEKFELTHPDSLTYIKNGYEGLAFSFPSINNEKVDFPSAKYKGKVVVIQLMGSWCPNCMDETRYLKDVYRQYHSQGLEIISLCYEKSGEFEEAARNVRNHKNHIGAEWDFLIAGGANKGEAGATLPMLNHIMSFPTTIYIDKNGKVRKIHTGFYGPGTGSYFERFSEMNQTFLEKLLAE